MIKHGLIAASIVCIAISMWLSFRGKGETREIFLPPFAFVFGPGVNWGFAALCLAFLSGGFH